MKKKTDKILPFQNSFSSGETENKQVYNKCDKMEKEAD